MGLLTFTQLSFSVIQIMERLWEMSRQRRRRSSVILETTSAKEET